MRSLKLRMYLLLAVMFGILYAIATLIGTAMGITNFFFYNFFRAFPIVPSFLNIVSEILKYGLFAHRRGCAIALAVDIAFQQFQYFRIHPCPACSVMKEMPFVLQHIPIKPSVK